MLDCFLYLVIQMTFTASCACFSPAWSDPVTSHSLSTHTLDPCCRAKGQWIVFVCFESSVVCFRTPQGVFTVVVVHLVCLRQRESWHREDLVTATSRSLRDVCERKNWCWFSLKTNLFQFLVQLPAITSMYQQNYHFDTCLALYNCLQSFPMRQPCRHFCR